MFLSLVAHDLSIQLQHRRSHKGRLRDGVSQRPSAASSFLRTESRTQAEAGMPWGGWGSAGDGEGVAAGSQPHKEGNLGEEAISASQTTQAQRKHKM